MSNTETSVAVPTQTLVSREPQVKIFKDWDFMVLAKLGDNQLHVNFEIYKLEQVRNQQDLDNYLVPKFGDEEPSDVERFIHGFVKWDGCSNWMFDCNEKGTYYMHACSRADLERIGKVLGLCYDWAAALMPESWSVNDDEQPLPEEPGENHVQQVPAVLG